ncbi:MAG TPA: DNA polymerase III subunit delta [Chitinophagales bacterium]|nr:DNA polymerase III subunit delta [Chitinophagales bacterium]HNK97532.1 DNA polymerase III subunit delta [Chitinophagales bacterium]
MDYRDLINDIKARKFKPVYLLHGDEAYYIDKIAEYMEDNILPPDQKDFNFSVFYGKDTHPQTVIDTSMRFPMFSDFNVVMLKEAQMMKGKGNEIDKLETYIEKASPTTILIICYKEGRFDARKRMFKLIKEKGVIFESETIKESELPMFIESYLKRKKASIDSAALRLLVQYLGADLAKMSNELDKLCINLPESGRISVDQIEKNIGISKDYNAYELQSALLTKNFALVYTIVSYINDNQKANPFIFTISNIHAAFQRLYHYLLGGEVSDFDMYKVYQIHSSQKNEYKAARRLYTVQRVEEIFELLLDYDLRSKGLNNGETEHDELLREMVYKIMS